MTASCPTGAPGLPAPHPAVHIERTLFLILCSTIMRTQFAPCCLFTCAGGGHQTRSKYIKTQPQCGGQVCGSSWETQSCNSIQCSPVCQVSEWSNQTACTLCACTRVQFLFSLSPPRICALTGSAPCGGGTQTSTRTVTVTTILAGANYNCPDSTETVQTLRCNNSPWYNTLKQSGPILGSALFLMHFPISP